MPHEPAALYSAEPRPVTSSFDVDVCPSALPDIRPQELRIIGRVVSFTAEIDSCGQRRSCAFKGWVSHITKETVTLLDVVRFDDVSELSNATRTIEQELLDFPIVLHEVSDGPAPIMPSSSQPEGALATPSVSNVRRLGRLPYVTFPRKKIRSVKFETDVPLRAPTRLPDTEPFLSKELSPAWFPHDAQKVRMFVRRYIIHTAQNNNGQRLSLVSFLETRLGVVSLDRDLLNHFVVEEMHDLMSIDADITSRTAQVQQANELRAQQAQQQVAANMGRAPIARLHATGIVSRTTYIAIGEFACAVGLLLYSASVFTTTEVDFLLDFMRGAITMCVIAGAVLVITSISTAVSVVGIASLPLSTCKMVWRTFTTLAGLGITSATVALLVRCMFKYIQLDGTTLFNFYLDRVATQRNDVCDLFKQYSCSGWVRLCDSTSSSSTWAKECPSPHCTTSFGMTCKADVEHKVRNNLLPLLAMVCAAALFVFLDAMHYIRLRRVAHRLVEEQRLPPQ